MDISPRTAFDATISPFPERPIIYFEDWRTFTDRKPSVKPEMPTFAAYKVMSKTEQSHFNRTREYYHHTFGPINVPIMQKIHEAGMRLALQNLHAPPGARPGIILDGAGTVGKSTIAMQFGRRYELRVTKNHTIDRTPTGDIFLPVVYITLPGEMTIKNVDWLFVQFYNIPAAKTSKDWYLTARIKDHAANCGTSLVIIDDIHFLKIKNRSHEIVNDHIKHLANTISATFMYAGINCEGGDLLTEAKKPENAIFSQTSHRFKKFDINPYLLSSDHQNNTLVDVLDYFETNLLLFNQTEGSLRKEAEYIESRTGGYIGAISSLLRESTTIAIKSKEEKITRKLMSKVTLDYSAEKRYKVARQKGIVFNAPSVP